MEVVTIENLHKLCPDISNKFAQQWTTILNNIECPENFQSLQYVLHTLHSAYLNYPEQFRRTFDIGPMINRSLFDCFMNVDMDAFPQYRTEKLQRGSKSERPIFALLFTFSERLNSEAILSLLLFLEHYFENEAKITARGKEEDVFRAYRLLYTDQLFDHNCLIGSDATAVASQLDEFKKHLYELEENDDARRMSGYVRELIHFYLLDWTSRTRRRRKSASNMRAAYQRSGYERVYGADELYTIKLRKPTLSEDEKLSGLVKEEDFPPISFIKTEASESVKPNHETPNKAVIRDAHKEKLQQRLIQRESKKSHNLSLMSRNVLQQYEVHYLFDELLSVRKGDLGGIDLLQPDWTLH